jgi:Flp pilus assembly protein TadB
MGFHEQIALKARLDGETAAVYRHAADQHGRAFWIYLLLAGMVWYFTAWYWALMPAALAVFVVIQSISATAVATRLDKLENP